MIKVKGDFFKELIPDLNHIMNRYMVESTENEDWDRNTEWYAHTCALIVRLLYEEFQKFSEKEEVEITQKHALGFHEKLGAIIEWCNEFLGSDLASLDITEFFQETKELAEKLKEDIIPLFMDYADKINDPIEKIWDLASLASDLRIEAIDNPNYLPGLKAALDEMVEIYNTEIKEELDEEVSGIMDLYFKK